MHVIIYYILYILRNITISDGIPTELKEKVPNALSLATIVTIAVSPVSKTIPSPLVTRRRITNLSSASGTMSSCTVKVTCRSTIDISLG